MMLAPIVVRNLARGWRAVARNSGAHATVGPWSASIQGRTRASTARLRDRTEVWSRKGRGRQRTALRWWRPQPRVVARMPHEGPVMVERDPCAGTQEIGAGAPRRGGRGGHPQASKPA
jgi:hypothetical protein